MVTTLHGNTDSFPLQCLVSGSDPVSERKMMTKYVTLFMSIIMVSGSVAMMTLFPTLWEELHVHTFLVCGYYIHAVPRCG